MTATYASNLQPLDVGTVDTGDFSSWLGKPIQIGGETYIMVKAVTGGIASSMNGRQLISYVSGGVINWNVAPATGAAGTAEYYCVGAIPSTLTSPITGSAYFLALRDSPGHVLSVKSEVTGGDGGINSGTVLMPAGTGSALVPVITASLTTITAVTSQVENSGRRAGWALENITSTSIVSASVHYHAPFRGAQ